MTLQLTGFNAARFPRIPLSTSQEIKSLTVTMTLSPNTCEDPNTQKTSYRSRPESIAAAVAKLQKNHNKAYFGK